MQDRKRLQEAVTNDAFIRSMTSDLETLFELSREGESVTAEIEQEMRRLRERLAELETSMLLAGENDRLSAIVTIHPGAGGTESQDWAEMLLRMYLRWAERKGFPTEVTDRLLQFLKTFKAFFQLFLKCYVIGLRHRKEKAILLLCQ